MSLPICRTGFARGDRVAILSANRAEYLAAYYGIMRAGLVAVPVNYRFPRETIHFILADCGAKLVFCDGVRRADCPDMPVVAFGSGDRDGFDAFLDPGTFQPVLPEQGEAAMFLYTSGSTGRPKGVVLSHQSHLWVVETRLAGQNLSGERFLIAAPLYHMNALALAKLACAAHATIVLLPQFSAREYIAAIERYRVTWLTAVPPMIAMMLRETELLARSDLSSVKSVRMGSAPVSASLMTNLRRLLPRATIINAYGTTEAGPVVFGPHPKGLPQPELSVGYPHPKVQLRLVDGDNRNAAQGVLEMKCPALMSGYHNRPDVPPPFTEDGFYITGDVFRRDGNGFHYFVGRADDMFVSGGENIYPAEVERMLEESIDFAEQDFAQRQLIEARNEGEAILRATEKGLRDEAAADLPAAERARIDAAMAALRHAMTGADYKQIRARMDELNQATAQLAELLINRVLHATVEGKRLDEV